MPDFFAPAKDFSKVSIIFVEFISVFKVATFSLIYESLSVNFATVLAGTLLRISNNWSFGKALAASLSISPMPGTFIMFFISGKSVTVVDPAVWSGALLNAL